MRSKETLEAFARRVGDVFQIRELERRESSNYVEGEYYVGTALSLAVVFARADEEDLDGYEFWIHFRTTGAWVQDAAFIDGLADFLARRLTVAGDTVVRILNAELRNREKFFYSLNANAPYASAGQVLVRQE
ncbi:MAG TPA: hypothetical protein VK745_28200 [Polyangiaceae bacterium]|nr:hypothetical protein [Polyangiaceae bacterium]